jgi:hypothetical protein
MINRHYLTRNQLARLGAAKTPTMEDSGFSPASRNEWSRVSYFKDAHSFMHPSLSVEGIELFTPAEAEILGEQYRTERAHVDAMAKELYKLEMARVAKLAHAKSDRMKRCTMERKAKLSQALIEAGLPSIDLYPMLTLTLKKYLKDYLSDRISEPYPLSEAVDRVRLMVQNERTIVEDDRFQDEIRSRRINRGLWG